MSLHPRVRRFAGTDASVVPPALPLGHADVQWDALPHAVQADVLARWCEMLGDVMTRATAADTVVDEATS